MDDRAAAAAFDAVIAALEADDVEAATVLIADVEARVAEFVASAVVGDADADRLLALWRQASAEAQRVVERLQMRSRELGVSQRARRAYG